MTYPTPIYPPQQFLNSNNHTLHHRRIRQLAVTRRVQQNESPYKLHIHLLDTLMHCRFGRDPVRFGRSNHNKLFQNRATQSVHIAVSTAYVPSVHLHSPVEFYTGGCVGGPRNSHKCHQFRQGLLQATGCLQNIWPELFAGDGRQCSYIVLSRL